MLVLKNTIGTPVTYFKEFTPVGGLVYTENFEEALDFETLEENMFTSHNTVIKMIEAWHRTKLDKTGLEFTQFFTV